MCGITGIVSLTGIENNDQLVIKRMTGCLSHRGPDNQEVWVDRGVSLGHARLKIIDLSEGGNQPMHSTDDRYVLVYNGEIYNYKQLRSELQARGYKFRGRSDTEVLLNMLSSNGVECLPKLNGIFAFALWDRKEQTVLLCRDRFGVKPLYFYLDSQSLVFGSEIKAILASEIPKREINPQGLSEFCFFGNALGRQTLFEGIQKVEPGQWIRVEKNKIKKGRFWSLPKEVKEECNPNEVIENSRILLKEAVERQLVSDVPLGVFLSGGIDSSAITAFATEAYAGKLKTFSAGFDFDRGVNELPLAKKISQLYGTDHEELHINGGNVEPLIEKMISYHDEPFSDCANIPLYLLTKELGNQVPVILQGDGGDEIFAGYKRYVLMRYQFIWKVLKIFSGVTKMCSQSVGNRVRRAIEIYGNNQPDGKQLAKMLTTDDQELSLIDLLSNSLKDRLLSSNPFSKYEAISSEFEHLDQLQKLLYCDTTVLLPDTFLEKVDKSTMANSVEVRVPFLDNELTDYILSLPSNMKIRRGKKKWILKRALAGIVPDQVLYGPKKGFGVPFGYWLSGKLYKYAREVIGNVSSDLLNSDRLLTILDDHKRSPNFRDAYILWKAINLSVWYEKYIR